MDKIIKLREIIGKSNNIVLFTGAGISVPSGIPDFRSNKGLYMQKYGSLAPEEIISKSFFYHNPKVFYDYYKTHLIYEKAKPNKAHYYFANLEKEGKLKATITQNIDNLHQEAGSKVVYELHGSVYRNYCIKCRKFYGLEYILKNDLPTCECGGLIKPDVVLYEDTLDNIILDKSIKKIEESDTLIVVGTSLTVYPAAGLIQYFHGKNLVLINKSKTAIDSIVDIAINDDIINVIEQLEK